MIEIRIILLQLPVATMPVDSFKVLFKERKGVELQASSLGIPF